MVHPQSTIELVGHDNDVDFYVIVNYPPPHSFYDPKKTIVIQMEPYIVDKNLLYGTKTWGAWTDPDPQTFLAVHTNRTGSTNCYWQNHFSVPQFLTTTITKTKDCSSICSSKRYDEGHKFRLNLIDELTKINFPIDVYGEYNHRPLTQKDKHQGYLPYKYYVMAENSYEENYHTEKIWEPILYECLCFYWGHPSITKFIDERCFVLLDRTDVLGSIQIIRDSIANNLWEKRLAYIKMEKMNVLLKMNLLRTVEDDIKKHEKLKKNFPINDIPSKIMYSEAQEGFQEVTY